jgi:hypothetical protein
MVSVINATAAIEPYRHAANHTIFTEYIDDDNKINIKIESCIMVVGGKPVLHTIRELHSKTI